MGRRKVDAPKTRYLDVYMKCWRLLSMGSGKNMNPIRYWSVVVICVMANSALIGCMYWHVYTHSSDIDGIAEIVDFATLFSSGLFRYLHTVINGRQYDEIVTYVYENFKLESVSYGEKLTMDKYVKKIKIVNYSYIGLTVFWVMQVTATRMVYRSLTQTVSGPIVAIEVDMPFDVTTQIGTILTYVIHLTSYYTTVWVYCLLDAYYFVILMLAIAQFELITYNLRTLSKDSKVQREEIDLVNVERIVTSCVCNHQILRRCIGMVEDLLNSVVFVDFLHGIISVTFILFDITIAINQLSAVKLINLIGYLLVSFVHMWILDYFGNELTDKEEAMSRAVYEIPWYKYPMNVRKEILLMMVLSSRPSKLTGGKFYCLSLEFFGKSVRTIFSYFTVLLQLKSM